MEIVQPTKINRDAKKTTAQTSIPKESVNPYPFHWLIFKPQLHAVEPFVVNEPSRNRNYIR